jgi:hypothetical protein
MTSNYKAPLHFYMIDIMILFINNSNSNYQKIYREKKFNVSQRLL